MAVTKVSPCVWGEGRSLFPKHRAVIRVETAGRGTRRWVGKLEVVMGMVQNEPEEASWQMEANCLGVDPDLFFPERGASTKEAKAVCRGCVVREECLEYALANGEKFGIWGGLSERERRRIRRQRALARAAAAERSASA